MWCEEFLYAYQNRPVDRLSEYYDRTSVFIKITNDGQWTDPVMGTYSILDRLTKHNLSGDFWPIVVYQKTRIDGLLVVLESEDGRGDKQILFVQRLAVSSRVVVSNHFYVVATTGMTDNYFYESFQRRFKNYATSLDNATLNCYRMAFRVGLMIGRDYYACCDHMRWQKYNSKAKFSCVRHDIRGDRVYCGLKSIKRQYANLGLNYQDVKIQTMETCWSITPKYGKNKALKTSTMLVVGTLPGTTNSTRSETRLEFVQIFLIDTRTEKILNDVLCFKSLPQVDNKIYSLSSTISDSELTSPYSSDTNTSLSFLSSNDNHSSRNTADEDGLISDSKDERPSTDELVSMRSRLAVNSLKARLLDNGEHELSTQNAVTKHNPRQLFIGCVPLHVKYGQLKLLFEQFGEVTYVKVYEGYNKQTGVKMLHNYAFLFFKDEVSVERAIAASPVPLDSNWNLNVSRPHHYSSNSGDR